MVNRNKNIAKLPGGYLFPEIAKRRKAYEADHPDAKVISLGIGDTPGPLPTNITAGLVNAAKGMGTKEGYSGYPGQGLDELRQLINDRFYHGKLELDEIFISDGAKCDTGRLQMVFGADNKIALQNPAYPVYLDTAVAVGQTGDYDEASEKFANVCYLDCNPENNFFPDLEAAKSADIIFFCSPNNPTGATATREQLEELVSFAIKNNSTIVFDAAYSAFINSAEMPSSIFEIEGAKDVAIEINSFSKFASYTGVRLGWTVVPKSLKFSDGSSVHKDWSRIFNTFFNGTSHITQVGGVAVLKDSGWEESKAMVKFFMANAAKIKATLEAKGLEVYAGENAPYIWVKIPGKTSWETFDYLLQEAQIVCTPGSGFGTAGEGFVRFSAFGTEDNVVEACRRLSTAF